MKNKYILYTTLAFMFSTPAHATDYTYGHGYVGVGLGNTSNNTRSSYLTSPDVCNVVGSNCRVDKRDDAWQVYGGYKVSPFISLEGAYIDLGKTANITDGTIRGTQDTKGVSIAAVGKVPLGYASLYGKAGLYHWDSDVSIGGQHTDASGTDPVIGAGLEYKMAPHWTARLGWDRYYNVGEKHSLLSNAGPSTLKTDVDVYTIGIHYNF